VTLAAISGAALAAIPFATSLTRHSAGWCTVINAVPCARVRLGDIGTKMADLPIAVHEVDHWRPKMTRADLQSRLNSVATKPKSGPVVAQCRRAAVPLDHERWGRRPGDPQGD
jgi:hypothetical protein